MATKKVYDACCLKLRSMNISSIDGKGNSTRMSRPLMKKLFGEKLIVDNSQLACCSETENRRHLYEDKVLRFLYLEDQSYNGFIVEK